MSSPKNGLHLTQVFSFLFILFFIAASASGTYAQINNITSKHKIVRVGYFEDNNGFQYGFSDKERKSGYAYEYYQEIAKYTGWDYQYIYGSWNDIYNKLINGEIDVMAGVSKTNERLKYILYPDSSMGTEQYHIFIPVDSNKIKGSDISTLNGKSIGVNANSLMETLLIQYRDEHKVHFEIKTYDGHLTASQALKDGKIDGIVIVDNYDIDTLKPVIKIGSSDFYTAVNKNRPDLLSDLNYAQDQILATNPYYISLLQQKYFNKSMLRQALNDNEISWLKNKKIIHLGYLDEYLPFCSKNKNGELIGLLGELIPKFSAFLGIEIRTTCFSTRQDLNTALRSGAIDAAFPAYSDIWYTEQLGFYQTNSIASDRVMLIFRGKYDDSLFKNIAIADTTFSQKYLVETYYPDSKVTTYKTRREYFDAVLDGKNSCSMGCGSILEHFIKENKEYSKLNTAYLDISEKICFITNKKDLFLYSVFNKIITSIDPAEITNALIRYSNVEEKYTVVDFIKYHVVAIMSTLILILFCILYMYYIYRKKMVRDQKELQLAVNEAKAANQIKTDFLSRMSHDIRTPLNGIIGMLEIEENFKGDMVKQSECHSKIRTASQHLLSLINDVLDMSKLESGKIEFSEEPFDIRESIKNCWTIIEAQAKEKQIIIKRPELDVFTEPYVIGSPLHCRQIFINIAGNAIKYNKKNGSVTFTADAESDGSIVKYSFSISDTGIGMSRDFMAHLFEPFTQAHSDARTEYNGTGLGLSIARKLIEQMGGEIHVSSELGQGTTFFFMIPFKIDKSIHNRIPYPQRAAKNIEGVHILLVEDHNLNIEIAQFMLKKAKAQVTIARNGKEALDIFSNAPGGTFDVILMDVMMPVMDGLTASRKIRELPRNDARRIPIIAMTANAFIEDIRKCKDAGMNDHIAKPIKSETLIETITKHIERIR